MHRGPGSIQNRLRKKSLWLSDCGHFWTGKGSWHLRTNIWGFLLLYLWAQAYENLDFLSLLFELGVESGACAYQDNADFHFLKTVSYLMTLKNTVTICISTPTVPSLSQTWCQHQKITLRMLLEASGQFTFEFVGGVGGEMTGIAWSTIPGIYHLLRMISH